MCATPTDLLKDHQTNLVLANEYLDFIEFLQNELGHEVVEELQEKFDRQEIAAGELAYNKFKNKGK